MKFVTKKEKKLTSVKKDTRTSTMAHTHNLNTREVEAKGL